MSIFDYTVIYITLLLLLLLFYSVYVYTKNVLKHHLDDKEVSYESNGKNIAKIDDIEDALRKIVKDEMANLLNELINDADKPFDVKNTENKQSLYDDDDAKRSYSKVPKTNLSLIVDNTKFKEAI